MALKSYRLKLKKKGKKVRRTTTRDLVVGTTGALIGVAFVSQTANVLNRL